MILFLASLFSWDHPRFPQAPYQGRAYPFRFSRLYPLDSILSISILLSEALHPIALFYPADPRLTASE